MIRAALQVLRYILLAGLLWPGIIRASELQTRADALLEQLHAAGHFSGAAIIGKDGAALWEGGVGRADAVRLFTPDTVADGGSLAKTVTAAAIWQLVADSRLRPNDPVQRHLAEFPYAGVTIRNLLSHSAGLPDIDPFAPVLENGMPLDNLALQDFMGRRSAKPRFLPGTRFEYCNICFSILALVVERVTGRPYADVAVAGVSGGAGARTAFLRPVRLADWQGPRTLGYRSAHIDAPVFDIYDNEAIYGESNIQWSARDLHAWASAWALGKVLPAHVRAQALRPARIGATGSALTLANWYCRGTACYFTGHHQGFFSFAFWDSATRQSAVFISNSTLPPPLHTWMFRSLLALGEDRLPAPMPVVLPAAAEVGLETVAGRYLLPGMGVVHVIVDDEGAFVQEGKSLRYSVFPVGHELLYVPGRDAYLSFGSDVAGRRVLRWDSLFREAVGAQITAN